MSDRKPGTHAVCLAPFPQVCQAGDKALVERALINAKLASLAGWTSWTCEISESRGNPTVHVSSCLQNSCTQPGTTALCPMETSTNPGQGRQRILQRKEICPMTGPGENSRGRELPLSAQRQWVWAGNGYTGEGAHVRGAPSSLHLFPLRWLSDPVLIKQGDLLWLIIIRLVW